MTSEKNYSKMYLQALQDLRNGVYYHNEGNLEHADLLINRAKQAFLHIYEEAGMDLAEIGLIEATRAQQDLIQTKYNMAYAEEAIQNLRKNKIPVNN